MTEFTTFRSSARRMRPTKAHRMALWENMLGTVYARNAEGVVEYFDYDYAAALRHIGPHSDVRVWKNGYPYSGDYQMPRRGQLVWYVRQD
jgi:hypothetical protein